jgi:hypothetical protein
MYLDNDVVKIRHPFLRKRTWLVRRSFPSLKEGVQLYRIALLKEDGNPHELEITVTEDLISENLGGYDQWVQSKN